MLFCAPTLLRAPAFLPGASRGKPALPCGRPRQRGLKQRAKLLQKISANIRKYIVLRPEALIATALWTMTAWAHEGATHSPILAAISVEPDSGKSSLLGVLRFLAPKPFVSVEPTGPSVYRTVDREHPTLIIDEADDLFYRKSDLRAIVNAG